LEVKASTIQNYEFNFSNQMLSKRINSSNLQQTQYFDILRDKPFWIWSLEEHKQVFKVKVTSGSSSTDKILLLFKLLL